MTVSVVTQEMTMTYGIYIRLGFCVKGSLNVLSIGSVPVLEGLETVLQEILVVRRFLRFQIVLQLRGAFQGGNRTEHDHRTDVVGRLGEVRRQGFADIVSDFAFNLKHCHEVKVRVRSVEEGVYELAFLRGCADQGHGVPWLEAERLRFALDEHRPGVTLDLYRLRNLDEFVHRA